MPTGIPMPDRRSKRAVAFFGPGGPGIDEVKDDPSIDSLGEELPARRKETGFGRAKGAFLSARSRR